jgi:16S rRNA (cytosine967-C5)-methyltransferase
MTDSPFTISKVATSSAEKRAISYASTIFNLFDSVLTTKQPADRIIANYFREHKKHGSKDRRVIRESLFSLFRWWGWIQQLGEYQQQETFFSMLASAAQLENHSWIDIRDAWLTFGKHSHLANPLPSSASDNVVDKLDLFKQFSQLDGCTLEQLLPAWFWQHCLVDSKIEKQALIQAMSSRPPIWARAQQASTQNVLNRLSLDNIQAVGSEYFSDTINLGHNSVNLNQVAAYTEGLLEIQDIASQVIGQTCDPKPDSQWWDACSGAGGKSLQLLSLMQQAGIEGHVTASDIRLNPLNELLKRAKRANFKQISISPWKTEQLPVKSDFFDGVLVDAPCSCTGTWRRNPDMRWIDDVSSIEMKPQLQLDILKRSADGVKVGGELVYATCSLAQAENQQVVKAFLQSNVNFELVILTHPFDGTQSNMITVWPQQADSDGMFVAKMRRIK